MYCDYVKERLGDDSVNSEIGFATFRFINGGKSVYIIDIYVRPSYRKQGSASAFADIIVDIARKRGCTEVIGTVSSLAKNSTDSLKVLLGYGMSAQSFSNDVAVFRKDI